MLSTDPKVFAKKKLHQKYYVQFSMFVCIQVAAAFFHAHDSSWLSGVEREAQ